MKKTIYLSLKTSFRIAVQGRWVTRIITVLLSAFAFALFSLASCGFTYNRTDYLTRGYLYSLNNVYPYTSFYYSHNDGYVNGVYWESAILGQEYIDLIKSETGLEYAHTYTVQLPWQVYIYDSGSLSKPGNEIKMESAKYINGSEEIYQSLGLEPLAGRFPQNVTEIAVSENFFDVFRVGGYMDVSQNYVYDQVADYYVCNGTNRASYEEITEYSDMIGKKFVCYGNTETGVYDKRSIYEVTVVGVIRVNVPEYARNNPVTGVYVSDEWHEIFAGENDMLTTGMIAPAVTTYSQAKTCVNLTLKMIESRPDELTMYGFSGALGVEAQASDMNEDLIITIFCGAGVFFGIFAVLLNGYLTTCSVADKQKKIGILRSLGAADREVTRIFIIETLMVCISSFFIALCIGIVAFKFLIYPAFFQEDFGICMLAYNGWNVLILFALSFAVPLLCTIAPLKKFFKKPIVDNINEKAVITKRK